MFSSKLYSLSIDYTEEDSSSLPWIGIVQSLSINKLKLLKSVFKEKLKAKFEVGLNREEFLNAICSLFDNSKYEQQSVLLFDDITKGKKATITWNDFLDILIENIIPKASQEVLLSLDKIDSVSHAKREMIVKIVLIETDKYFCYAVVSKYGRIGLYDGNLNFLISYHVIMTIEDLTRSEDERRRRNRWVTDALFCEDVLMFIVTNSARSIVIYEASGLKHVPYWFILTTPNIPKCLDYKCSTEEITESVLFVGDDIGKVISLKFIQPKVGFLRRKHNDDISLFYWNELPGEKDYVLIKFYGRIHMNSVEHIKYCEKNKSIFTCARDSNASVVKTHISSKKKCIFKISKGASSFTLSDTLKLLITGSDDGIVRLWNILVNSNPIVVLSEHRGGIVDIKLIENHQLLLSCSKDQVLKVWDAKEYSCLQTHKIKFPTFGIKRKPTEWGINCIFPGPKRKAAIDAKKCFSGDNLSEVQQNDELTISEHTVWERSHILVTSFNYIATVKLAFFEANMKKIFEQQVLPPPPLQISVLIPTSWKMQDKADASESEKPVEGTDTVDHTKRLNFILDRETTDNSTSRINYKMAILETKKLQMQRHVARGAPYIALDLFDVQELTLTENLPVPSKKITKSVLQKMENLLVNASIKDKVFSESSSSRSKSSRSSISDIPY